MERKKESPCLFRLLPYVVLGLAAVLFLPSTLGATTITMTFSTCIDGGDRLIVQGGTLQWQYESYIPVGEAAYPCPANSLPTSITTTLNGKTVLSTEWTPVFPNSPLPGSLSLAFSGLEPLLPSNPESVTLAVIEGRSQVTKIESPTKTQDFPLVLGFYDAPTYAAIYTVKVTITTTPEPVSLILLLSGFAVTGLYQRLRNSV